MTLPEFIAWIRQEHPCCLTTSVRENRCSLRLANFRGDSLAIINGTKYQTNHRDRTSGKLADRIIFSARDAGFVCVAELKGGSWKARDTVEQVRSGFELAQQFLDSQQVQIGLSIPLVLSRQGINPGDGHVLENNPLGLPGNRRRLIHSHCNTELDEIMRRS